MYSDFASRSPSQPIKIGGTSSQTTESYHNRNRDDSDSSYSSSSIQQMDDDFISADKLYIPPKFHNLTVGSLPAGRTGNQFIISDANNDRNHLGFAKQGAFRSNPTQNYDTEFSRSLPVPRAPYLHSRTDRDSGERLSRIPTMTLPESMTDNSLSSSIPYGSLNESQFRRPRLNSVDTRSLSNRTALSSSYNPSSQLDIQRRVQEMKKHGTLVKNGKGSLASLLDQAESILDQSDSPHQGIFHDAIATANASPIQDNSPNEFIPLPLHALKINDSNHEIQYESEPNICGSLTGLSILKNSKGALVHLNQDEKEAMVNLSRSFHTDIPNFLGSEKIDEIIAQPSFHADGEIPNVEKQPSSDQQEDDSMFHMDM